MYEVHLENPAEKFLNKLDSYVQKRIIAKLEQLGENPQLGVPLIGAFKGQWKLRVGKYRAIYQIIKNKLIISVIDLGHRKNVYG